MFLLTERDSDVSIELSKVRSASLDVGVGFGDVAVVVDSVPDGIIFRYILFHATDLNYNNINQRFWR